jgi:hypothetical protein
MPKISLNRVGDSVNSFEPFNAPYTQPSFKGILRGLFGANLMPSAGNTESMFDALQRRNRETDATRLGLKSFINAPLVEKLGLSGSTFKAVNDVHHDLNSPQALSNFGRLSPLSESESAGVLDSLRNNFYKKAVEKLKGGAGDNMPDCRYSRKELAKGVKHESEHTNNKGIAKEIAKDHLEENKHYYSMLAKTKIGGYLK